MDEEHDEHTHKLLPQRHFGKHGNCRVEGEKVPFPSWPKQQLLRRSEAAEDGRLLFLAAVDGVDSRSWLAASPSEARRSCRLPWGSRSSAARATSSSSLISIDEQRRHTRFNFSEDSGNSSNRHIYTVREEERDEVRNKRERERERGKTYCTK